MSTEPEATRLLPAPPAERHDGWTPARQAEFLRELAATHCVSTAARAVGMGRQSAYKLRNRLKGEPFDVAWHAAFRQQYDALAEVMLARAINGVEVPHFYKGELIHTSRRYDERAAVALLALRERLVPAWPRLRAEEEGYGPKTSKRCSPVWSTGRSGGRMPGTSGRSRTSTASMRPMRPSERANVGKVSPGADRREPAQIRGSRRLGPGDRLSPLSPGPRA